MIQEVIKSRHLRAFKIHGSRYEFFISGRNLKNTAQLRAVWSTNALITLTSALLPSSDWRGRSTKTSAKRGLTSQITWRTWFMADSDKHVWSLFKSLHYDAVSYCINETFIGPWSIAGLSNPLVFTDVVVDLTSVRPAGVSKRRHTVHKAIYTPTVKPSPSIYMVKNSLARRLAEMNSAPLWNQIRKVFIANYRVGFH